MVEKHIQCLFIIERLFHIAGFITQVEHHFVGNGFVELVGVDIVAEVFARGEFLLLSPEQWRAGETDKHHIVAHDSLHGAVEDASLRAVALVHKHIHVALGLEAGRQLFGKVFHILLWRAFASQFLFFGRESGSLLPCDAEFVDERANHIWIGTLRLGVGQHAQQVLSACCVHCLDACIFETIVYLQVELVAVGDDDHTRIVGHILDDPLGEPHHHQALACSLRVPDDAVLFVADAWLGCLKSEELVGAAHFLDAAVEDHAIVNEGEQPVGVEQLQK